MLSRIVPLNSQVSCSTTPKFVAQRPAVHAGDVDAVERDAAASMS